MRTATLLALVSLVTAVVVCIEVNHEAYLKQYGYISDKFVGDSSMEEAIKSFQSMFNIRVTGEMDYATRAAMNMPRCGHHDQVVIKSPKLKRMRRYRLLGTIWHHNTLTYRITKYSKKMSKYGTRKAAKKAFAYWTRVSPLKFRLVSERDTSADIEIRFETGDHGDNSPFDGPRKQLAHAFQPEDGRSHFDASEKWVLGSGAVDTINIMQVMTHEFGHLLGMGHSRDRKAVMAPYYKGYEPNFALGRDDIKGIQAMYGPGHGKTTTQAPTMPGEKDICDDPSFDAVTMADDWIRYGFKGTRYFVLNGGTGEPQAHPLTDWNGPSTVDAVLGIPRDRTLMFKGSKVYTVKNMKLMRGYPRSITSEFPGLPRGRTMTAAFLISGDAYFRYNDGTYYTARTATGSYAKRTSDPFGGRLPARIDGVFTHPKYFRFAFSGRYYYRITVDNRIITKRKDNTSYWVKCKKP